MSLTHNETQKLPHGVRLRRMRPNPCRNSASLLSYKGPIGLLEKQALAIHDVQHYSLRPKSILCWCPPTRGKIKVPIIAENTPEFGPLLTWLQTVEPGRYGKLGLDDLSSLKKIRLDGSESSCPEVSVYLDHRTFQRRAGHPC
jgi:hypothetical protein